MPSKQLAPVCAKDGTFSKVKAMRLTSAELSSILKKLKLRPGKEETKSIKCERIAEAMRGGAELQNVTKITADVMVDKQNAQDYAKYLASLRMTSRAARSSIPQQYVNNAKVARSRKLFDRWAKDNGMPADVADKLYHEGLHTRFVKDPHDWRDITRKYIYYPVAKMHDMAINAANTSWKKGDLLLSDAAKFVWDGRKAVPVPSYGASWPASLNIPTDVPANFYNFFTIETDTGYDYSPLLKVNFDENTLQKIHAFFTRRGHNNNNNNSAARDRVFDFEFAGHRYAVVDNMDFPRPIDHVLRGFLYVDPRFAVSYEDAGDAPFNLVSKTDLIMFGDDRFDATDELEECLRRGVPVKNIMALNGHD